MRLIDADKLNCETLPKKLYPHLQSILDFIDSQPTVDVVERSKIDEIIERVKDESYLSYDDNPRHILDEECVLKIIEEVLAKN